MGRFQTEIVETVLKQTEEKLRNLSLTEEEKDKELEEKFNNSLSKL